MMRPAAVLRSIVRGDIAAGQEPATHLESGTAVRIMTGAPVPQGADAVVPVEWTDGSTDQVAITRTPDPGAHIRRRGEDVAAGDVVLEPGITRAARLSRRGRRRQPS